MLPPPNKKKNKKIHLHISICQSQANPWNCIQLRVNLRSVFISIHSKTVFASIILLHNSKKVLSDFVHCSSFWIKWKQNSLPQPPASIQDTAGQLTNTMTSQTHSVQKRQIDSACTHSTSPQLLGTVHCTNVTTLSAHF